MSDYYEVRPYHSGFGRAKFEVLVRGRRVAFTDTAERGDAYARRVAAPTEAERLQARFELIPAWYWEHGNLAQKGRVEHQVKHDPIAAAGMLEYIEGRIEDWATD